MQNVVILFSFIIISTSIKTVEPNQWLTNFHQAQKKSIEEDKHILLVFQGSDWCAPCIKLEKEIWLKQEFEDYARENFVLVRADFPRRKKNALPESQTEHNASLAEKYNQKGIFPLVVILDKHGHRIGETGYKSMDVTSYIEHINEIIKS